MQPSVPASPYRINDPSCKNPQRSDNNKRHRPAKILLLKNNGSTPRIQVHNHDNATYRTSLRRHFDATIDGECLYKYIGILIKYYRQ
jgi:hypothetical protein